MKPMKFKAAGLLLFCLTQGGVAIAAETPSPVAAAVDAATPDILRFDISGFSVEGATLISAEEIAAVVAPYTGKARDFSDVQRALEAVEELYASKGYSAVHILLPEQELEKGAIRFTAIEGRFAKIFVKENQFVSEANAINALPSLRPGGVPVSKQIARELKLANENPARQLNVILKGGERDEEVDATILVTDKDPALWGITLDNSGTAETGVSRLGISYRHANLFDKDHVASLQTQISPSHTDRVKVLLGSYKIPQYQLGGSLEIIGAYSNVNSVVGGIDSFQGGGLMFSLRENFMLDRFAGFDPAISMGLDWRTFNEIKQTQPTTATLYNKIVATPINASLSATRKGKSSEFNFNLGVSRNLPFMSDGKEADFANYDPLKILKPDAGYGVIRYGASYAQLVAADWQLRAALSGQTSSNTLILGEQMRLGGIDGVRGFPEGAEGGEKGLKVNLEIYTPTMELWSLQNRALVFYDAGKVESCTCSGAISIASAGVGLRTNYNERLSMRLDAGRILKEGSDPNNVKGDAHLHATMTLTF